MLASGLDRVGGPEVLTLREVAEPTMQADALKVAVAIAGVNYQDVYYRNGTYSATLPLLLGDDGMGTVLEVGSEVSGFSVGDRVAWTGAQASYAQIAVVPARTTSRLPDDLPDEAGLLLAQGLTAHYLAHDTAALQHGDTTLVHAAAGGVGSLLTRVLRIRGVRVIGVVSSASKVQAARQAGASEVIVSSEADFAEAVLTLTGGRGVDVVFDGVGKPTFAQGLKCLRRRGTMVLYGASGGDVENFNPRALAAAGSISLIRPRLKDYLATRAEFEARVKALFDWVRQGQVDITIGCTFELSAAARAHQMLESRQAIGKLILRIPRASSVHS